jgi:hypothetical protein
MRGLAFDNKVGLNELIDDVGDCSVCPLNRS